MLVWRILWGIGIVTNIFNKWQSDIVNIFIHLLSEQNLDN